MNDETQNDTEAPDPTAGDPAAGDPTPNAEAGGEDAATTRGEQLQRERDELDNKLQYAMADLANMRRRHRQEVEDSRLRTLEGLTQEILPVLDTFGMALMAYDNQAEGDASNDPKALVEGVRMVKTMLTGVLERHGLREISSTGAFDPNHHEAIAMEPSDDVPEGQIIRAMLTGYLLGDRVVRHSRVVVSGNPPTEDGGNAKDSSDG